jgi:hypothetical protein
MLCRIRIRYTYFLVRLLESVLGGGIEESGESYGRCSYGVVYLVHHMCITSLESKDSDH